MARSLESGDLRTQESGDRRLLEGEPAAIALLNFDGVFTHASIAHSPAFVLGTDNFTGELRVTHNSIGAGIAAILSNSTEDLKGFLIERNAATLKIYLSSDGATWDIANGTTVATGLTVSEYYFTWERIDLEIIFYLNGTETVRVETALGIYDPGKGWRLGYYAGGNMSLMDVHSWRVNIGNYRYGSNHTATAIPFADSDSYTEGYSYSRNFALFWNDLARSNIYGSGANTLGVSEAKLWCEKILDSNCGTDIKQGVGGLVLSSTNRVERWLNILSDYANCIWFPEEDSLRILPDKIHEEDLPSGQEICLDNTFDSNTAWTEGDGWSISSGTASIDGSQVAESVLSQNLIAEASVRYVVEIDITTITAGSISIEYDDVEIISAQTEAGIYKTLITSLIGLPSFKIIASSDCIASINLVSCKRLYWLLDNWIKNSLSISDPSNRDIPNSVKIVYTRAKDDTPNWPVKTIEMSTPEAEAGDVPLIQTTLQQPGIYKNGRAENKAKRRLVRLGNTKDVSFLTTDSGVLHRVGDVIELKRSIRGVDILVWISKPPVLKDYGIYRVEGKLYDDYHFVDDCALPSACIPVSIEKNLQDINEIIGTSVTLTVEINSDATTPVTYVWYKNGVVISGETTNSITFNVEDYGDKYYAYINNACMFAPDGISGGGGLGGSGGGIYTSVSETKLPEGDVYPECQPYACDAIKANNEVRAEASWYGEGIYDSGAGGDYPFRVPSDQGGSELQSAHGNLSWLPSPIIPNACYSSLRINSIGSGEQGVLDPTAGLSENASMLALLTDVAAGDYRALIDITWFYDVYINDVYQQQGWSRAALQIHNNQLRCAAAADPSETEDIAALPPGANLLVDPILVNVNFDVSLGSNSIVTVSGSINFKDGSSASVSTTDTSSPGGAGTELRFTHAHLLYAGGAARGYYNNFKKGNNLDLTSFYRNFDDYEQPLWCPGPKP